MDGFLTTQHQLSAGVIVIAAGAMFLIALTARGRRRFLYGALLGVATSMLAAAALVAKPDLAGHAAIAGGGLLGGLAAMVLAAGLVAAARRFFPGTVEGLRDDLMPSRWLDSTDGAPPLTRRDLARRWFVAVGAATGATVGSLVATPEFLEALKRTVDPSMVFAVAVAAIASAVLFGPVQDYVMGRDGPATDGDTPEIEHFHFDDMSWRSALRLALVGLLFLLVALLFNCLQESVEAASAEAAMAIAVVSITPGIVSYYWSAALQIDTTPAPVSDAATAASIAGGGVLYYAWGVLVCVLLALTELRPALDGNPGDTTRGAIVLLVLSPALGWLVASVLAVVVLGVPAFLGGQVLERFSGWPAMAVLAAMLVVAALALDAILAGLFWLIADPGDIDWSWLRGQALFSAGGAIGWVAGLTASGFPQLVNKAKRI